jgi:hypothetical protein
LSGRGQFEMKKLKGFIESVAAHFICRYNFQKLMAKKFFV